MKESTELKVDASMPNPTSFGAEVGRGIPRLKNFLQFWNINAWQGAYHLHDFFNELSWVCGQVHVH